MPKRSRYQIKTKESETLKQIRIESGLSLREAARKCSIHNTVINHAENGRSTITREYIEKFLEGIKFSVQDFDDIVDEEFNVFELRSECKNIVSKMDGKKLRAVHGLLINFSN